MFDYVMFLKYASLIGMIVYGILLFWSLLAMYHFEFTEKGKLHKTILQIQTGKTIAGYSITWRLSVLCLCVLVFISIK